mmetsp:Transcript_10755/g.18144  ORF Transcript_10755/g.18144 Transcript_10755/m.18144 type:complete len:209 (-) Transcript_10755:176-802(-)
MQVLVGNRHLQGPPFLGWDGKLHIHALQGPVVGLARSKIASVQSPASLRDNHDSMNTGVFHLECFSWAHGYHHYFEFGHWRSVSENPGVFAGCTGVDTGPAHGVGEHADQVFHVLELGCEAGSDHIIATGHAFDDFSRHIGVWFVGGHEEGLTGCHEHVVEKEGGHGTRIARELLGETQNGSCALSFPRWLIVRMGVQLRLLRLQPNQ